MIEKSGKERPDAARLRSFVERIERLEEEREALTTDLADVYAEAARMDFDEAALRRAIEIRRLPAGERVEQERAALYLVTLGAN